MLRFLTSITRRMWRTKIYICTQWRPERLMELCPIERMRFNFGQTSSDRNATLPDVDYSPDVANENLYLYTMAPRTSDGALSHRTNEVQLWSDFLRSECYAS